MQQCWQVYNKTQTHDHRIQYYILGTLLVSGKKKKKNLEAQMQKYTQTHTTFNMWHVP